MTVAIERREKKHYLLITTDVYSSINWQHYYQYIFCVIFVSWYQLFQNVAPTRDQVQILSNNVKLCWTFVLYNTKLINLNVVRFLQAVFCWCNCLYYGLSIAAGRNWLFIDLIFILAVNSIFPILNVILNKLNICIKPHAQTRPPVFFHFWLTTATSW